MKTIKKIVKLSLLTLTILCSFKLNTASAYSWSSSYRNPYASYPSVSVRGYVKRDGTYVMPHFRTAPDGIRSNNLNYRGGWDDFGW